jgi:hypothetical protein
MNALLSDREDFLLKNKTFPSSDEQFVKKK